MNTETWKDVKGYEGFYQVSSTGQVLSRSLGGWKVRQKPKLLKPNKNASGYFAYKLSKGSNSKPWNVLAHRLVALNFLDNPNSLPQVNHKNGNKTDNRVENLEWVTRLENMRHSWANGFHRSPRGAAAHHAKLTVEQVEQIKELLKQPHANMAAIGRQFGVTCTHVSRIRSGTHWKPIVTTHGSHS